MALSELQGRVATVALRPAKRYGFALAGGGALDVHGITHRFTADVDLHTDRLGVMHLAAAGVEQALRDAGFEPERQMLEGGRDVAAWNAEWWVPDPGDPGNGMLLKLAIYGRQGKVKTMTVGPVLSVTDVVAGKVVCAVERADERDFVDLAEALGRYSAAELIAMGKAAHPVLEDHEFARAAQLLDRLPDEAFTRYGSDLSPADIRERFRDWPR
jgi:hypothetical protein